MCPKCGSRERDKEERPLVIKQGWIWKKTIFKKYRADIVRFVTMFYCSSCGYELGRYG